VKIRSESFKIIRSEPFVHRSFGSFVRSTRSAYMPINQFNRDLSRVSCTRAYVCVSPGLGSSAEMPIYIGMKKSEKKFAD